MLFKEGTAKRAVERLVPSFFDLRKAFDSSPHEVLV